MKKIMINPNRSDFRNGVIEPKCYPGDAVVKQYHIDPVTEEIIEEDYELDKVIQSYANEVAIDRIMARHLAGDIAITNAVPGINDINKFGDTDLQFLSGVKTVEEAAALQNQYIYKLYQSYSGKDKMSIAEFAQAINSGNWQALNVEVTDNGKIE